MFRVFILFFIAFNQVNAVGYDDSSFGHAPEIKPYIDQIIAEGKDFLQKIYRDEDLPVSKLETLFQDQTLVQSLKYAPTREACAVISGGLRYLSQCYYGESQQDLMRKKYLARLVTVMWGIFGESVDLNQGFGRGSYKLIDPDHRLYNFLLEYVKMVTGAEDPKTNPMLVTTCNFAYRRAPRLKGSSHYLAETVDDAQFGIDVRLASHQTPLRFLPADKSHILFAHIKVPGSDLPLTFIKFEEVGMGSYGEAADHATNYGASHSNVKDIDRREKDIPIAISNAFNQFLAAQGKESVKLKKVYEMCNYLEANSEDEAAFLFNLECFKTAIKQGGFEGNFLTIRNGNEVIMDFRGKVDVKAWDVKD